MWLPPIFFLDFNSRYKDVLFLHSGKPRKNTSLLVGTVLKRLRGVWISDETDFRVFRMASQMINNTWRNSRLKLVIFMVIRNTYPNHGHSSDWCRTNIRLFSVFYQGPKFFNSLSPEITGSSSLASFRKKFLKVLLSATTFVKGVQIWLVSTSCNISNTRRCVSSDIQTLRSRLKKRGAAEFF